MYLKALEIQGFKSFPDKTTILFGEAISAIVGPNGSGKSNISDAILWVMGEQSTRALRGGKMEDVIFSGTQKRGPVGFAQVTLTLDNTDHILPLEENEVTVTRRYYRSGESEYYINRTSVRLKDINELLMDTGLGREGYSIIGQGRIDEILSVKSEDRREIFEEAAGISRFRHRKEEAERKLQRTEENLVRIGDKISELELQVEPLKTQSETAKRYLVLRDELRVLEVSLWLDQLDRLKAEGRRAEQNYAIAAAQRDDLKAQVDTLYAQIEDCSAQMRDRDVKADRVRHSISELEGKQAAQESKIAVLDANIKNNRENEARVLQELSQQESRTAQLAAQMAEKERCIKTIEREMALRNEELSALMQQAETTEGAVQRARETLRQVTEKTEQKEKERSQLQLTLSALHAASEERLEQEARLSAEQMALDGQIQTAQAEAQAVQDALETIKGHGEALKNQISGYTLKLAAREESVEAAQKAFAAAEQERNACTARVQMLAEMEKDFEGYSKAVRIVMNEAGRGGLRGIRGPVANLMKAPDAYTVAIEVALGNALQQIVVETEQDGKGAITYLKRRDAGRATFLPMNAIRGKQLGEAGVRKEPGFIGIANELISYEAEYGEIFTSLLGRTVVVSELDHAVQIAKRFGYRFRIVTLDGQVVNPGGSMTGGSINKKAGILSRANELARLRQTETQMEKKLLDTQKVLEQTRRERDAVSYDLEGKRDEQRSLEQARIAAEADCRHAAERLDGLRARIFQLEADAQALKSRREQDHAEERQLQEQLNTLETDVLTLQQKAQESAEGDLQTEQIRLTAQLSEKRTEMLTLQAERDATRRSLEELHALQETFVADQAQGRSQAEALGQERMDMERARIAAETERSALLEEKGKAQTVLQAINEEKLQLEQTRVRCDKQLQDQNRTMLAMERECALLEQRKGETEQEENRILEKLWDTYELTHSAAMGMRAEVQSTAKTTRRISELKREMSALGTINLGAIAEFQRINERYEYFLSQRNDVTGAKEELKGVISTITKEMQEIFISQFTLLNQLFGETFSELFGGGAAKLELMDPNDVLSCGIELKVQPPGKALKTLTLLSGGEKAFVAIALYFAILKLRPTPFCIMDEIEAALDENNVARFARYLRNMSKRTQFIMITHRRGTMEEADILYGVTMQEQGISRILTLNLSDISEELNIQ